MKPPGRKFGGVLGVTASTVMEPSTARLLVQVYPVGRLTIVKPIVGWLRRVNLSPATSEGPTFVTVSVLPVTLSTPPTITKSLVTVPLVLFSSKIAFAPTLRVRLLLKNSVPMVAPGASSAPASRLVGPPSNPEPPRAVLV